MKTTEELKKVYEEKAAALKAEKKEAMKKAKAREDKKASAEKAVLRKSQNHIKIIIGGYMMSEFKRGENLQIIDFIIQSTKNEKDKKLFTQLKASLPSATELLKK